MGNQRMCKPAKKEEGQRLYKNASCIKRGREEYKLAVKEAREREKDGEWESEGARERVERIKGNT